MLPDKLDLYFDGSCGPQNPGGTAGYAWRLVDSNTKGVLAEDHGEVCRGPGATNNIAEWGAVKAGLDFLTTQNWRGELNIRGDSQLVIFQLLGRYKCRKDTLIPYYESCMLLLGNMQWDAYWIPREENDDCDKLSKLAYSGGERPSYRRSKRIPQGTAGNNGAVRPVVDGCGQDTVGRQRPAPGEETPEVAFD